MTSKAEEKSSKDNLQDKENDVYVLESLWSLLLFNEFDFFCFIEVEVSEESEPESLEIESIEETKEDEEDFNTLEKLL